MSEPRRIDRPVAGVVVLTLSLPARRNAMTGELTAAWGATVPAVAADPTVRAVVATGEGAVFCAVTMASQDMLEGIRAQVERRRPVFTRR